MGGGPPAGKHTTVSAQHGLYTEEAIASDRSWPPSGWTTHIIGGILRAELGVLASGFVRESVDLDPSTH